MKLKCVLLTAALAVAPLFVFAAEPVDFTKQIKPILEQNCLKCHGEEQKKGGLRLHTKEAAITGGDSGTALVAGKSKESPLYTSTVLSDDEKAMPPRKKEKPLSK